ncbi:MAG: VanZ family protein [Clostridia bacterium]|nr:VanZ family protein [Clostridia bacterium]
MKKLLERCRNALKFADARVFLASSLFLLLFAVSELLVHLNAERFPQSPIFRIVLTVLICVLFYLGGMLRADRTGERQIYMRLMWVFFGIYLYLILNFTLLDKGLGRIERRQFDRDYYLRWFVNFRPFQSIYEVYIKGFIHGYVRGYYIFLNLLGNVVAFMPFAFFLPLFFRAQRRWFVFLPTMILVVAGIEALQFAFMVGSCDVDDLILNVGGTMILFFLLKIKKLRSLLDRFTGTKKEA